MIDLVEFPPPCHPENSNWYQCVALCKLVGLHYVFFYMCDFLKRYGQNTVKNGRFWLHSHKSYYKQEVKKRRVSQYRPPNICQCIWSLVSLCSSLRAHLNALRGFFHTRFVGEISAKYCRTYYYVLFTAGSYIQGPSRSRVLKALCKILPQIELDLLPRVFTPI